RTSAYAACTINLCHRQCGHSRSGAAPLPVRRRETGQPWPLRLSTMHLLAYWRRDNYVRDLDEGAGFNFNSGQPRLHTEIEVGENLWLWTRLLNPIRYYTRRGSL